MAPSLKLTYFPFAGKAEPTRVMLAMAKLPFENNTVTFEKWPEVKPTTPFGQMPVLEVDGKPLAQAGAVERYVAKLAGLYPSDPWEAALVDQAACCVDEWLPIFAPSLGLPAEEKAPYLIKAVDEKFKPKLAICNGLLEKSSTGWVAGGSKPTYADAILFCYMSFCCSEFFPGVEPSVYDAYPALKAFHAKFAALPEISALYASAADRGPTFKSL